MSRRELIRGATVTDGALLLTLDILGWLAIVLAFVEAAAWNDMQRAQWAVIAFLLLRLAAQTRINKILGRRTALPPRPWDEQ